MKFSTNERKTIETLIETIISLDWKNLDIRKLKGYQNIFRVRKGDIRIILTKEQKDVFILSIDRRNENTYKV